MVKKWHLNVKNLVALTQKEKNERFEKHSVWNSYDVLNENFERMTPKTVKCLNIDRHPGTTFYQTSFIDPAVERLKMTCADLMQKNDILKSELEKLKEKPLLKGNENYQLVKENTPSGILIIKALAGHHQSWLYK